MSIPQPPPQPGHLQHEHIVEADVGHRAVHRVDQRRVEDIRTDPDQTEHGEPAEVAPVPEVVLFLPDQRHSNVGDAESGQVRPPGGEKRNHSCDVSQGVVRRSQGKGLRFGSYYLLI